ncbi:pyridoxamine 5'-phosphate oxidase family protein [Halogeometricum limi]|uniref:Pyridoxamine 5'-phosphate oxidase n=1 Tax=Halogeometricum limi TaxID=555875 RepID=A0A1I6I936_9EURY|nr:pyridoxamine 5'-phosphate oxidase family protein [Halogeometricum limi]SFR63242.1 hypothetical protein SAMN04488124_2874 [Halogeometricum limi]
MRDIEYVYTLGMDEDEVDERLREEAAGVLSLADGGTAYAVPVSHYYDGESLFFRFGDDDHSEKLAFAESTTEASFVVFGVEDRGVSWSIVATGTLREFPDYEREDYDAAELNDRFGPIRVFDETVEDVEIRLFELQIATLTGRKTSE